MKRLGLFIILLFGFLAGCGDASVPSDSQPLLADIALTKEHLIVRNGDPVVWKQVTLTINGEYSHTVDVVPRGGSSLPLSRFVDLHGKPFEPGLLHLRRLHIHVADLGDGTQGEFSW
jgi:hypothetical protein